MKTKMMWEKAMRKSGLILTILTVGLFTVSGAQALEDKDFHLSGQINDGDTWGNVDIYGDDTTVDMFDFAWVLNVTTHNKSTFNVYGGIIDGSLTCSDSSFVNIDDGDFGTITVESTGNIDIHSGVINALSATGGSINLYAYDVTYDSTGGYFGEGELTGKYYKNDNFFAYDLHEGVYPYINIVPEPTTFLLFGLGGIILRRRK